MASDTWQPSERAVERKATHLAGVYGEGFAATDGFRNVARAVLTEQREREAPLVGFVRRVATAPLHDCAIGLINRAQDVRAAHARLDAELEPTLLECVEALLDMFKTLDSTEARALRAAYERERAK